MRGAVTVALVLVVAGCSSFVGAPERSGGATLTPAPVPTETATRPVGSAPTDCLGPPPATPDAPGGDAAAPPTATPHPIREGDDVVAGHRLIAAHDAVIRDYGHHLVAGDTIEMWALPNATAFSYEGIHVNNFVSLYAANGRLYRLNFGESRRSRSIRERPYDPGNTTGGGFDPYTGVNFWLGRLVGPYEYRQVGTRRWNGTTVRVFREEFEDPFYVRVREIVSLNSTVYVDPRGIVRWIDHREEYRPARGEIDSTAWRNETFAVTDVGTSRVRRPPSFCGVAGAVDE